MTIHAARDAMDIMGCRHVLITGMKISGGGDDAVKFGSDCTRPHSRILALSRSSAGS